MKAAPAISSDLPRVLRVETGYNPSEGWLDDMFVNMLDYHICANEPRAWRMLEKTTRLDFYLAWRAKQIAADYDMIFAGSDKVALPLTWLGMPKPMVVVLHYPQSPARAPILRAMRVAKHWTAMGYVTTADKNFYIHTLGMRPDRVFAVHRMPLNNFVSTPTQIDGPILSLGVAKRDYTTLVAALEQLPGYETEIFANSRYGDLLKTRLEQNKVPEWVHFHEPLSNEDVLTRYQHARFVVVPLVETKHASAGLSVILEASASGKAVIATCTPGTPDYVRDGETGILVPPHDVQAMREALETLYRNPELAEQMGRRGREFVESTYESGLVTQNIRRMLVEIHKTTRA